jgi:hypothetical protein
MLRVQVCRARLALCLDKYPGDIDDADFTLIFIE